MLAASPGSWAAQRRSFTEINHPLIVRHRTGPIKDQSANDCRVATGRCRAGTVDDRFGLDQRRAGHAHRHMGQPGRHHLRNGLERRATGCHGQRARYIYLHTGDCSRAPCRHRSDLVGDFHAHRYHRLRPPQRKLQRSTSNRSSPRSLGPIRRALPMVRPLATRSWMPRPACPGTSSTLRLPGLRSQRAAALSQWFHADGLHGLRGSDPNRNDSREPGHADGHLGQSHGYRLWHGLGLCAIGRHRRRGRQLGIYPCRPDDAPCGQWQTLPSPLRRRTVSTTPR